MTTVLPFHQIDGCDDEKIITLKFAEHFAKISSNNSNRTTELLTKFTDLSSAYVGFPLTQDTLFNGEIVDSSMTSLSNGKAPGLDELTSEHLKYAHPAIALVLTKLFNLMLKCGIVPHSFGHIYSVPIPKGNCSRDKSVTVDDFRAISICPVISKVCVLDRFKNFLSSSDNQFCFKKNLGCNHAIYSLRKVVDSYTSNGFTVNICSLDLSKAIDETNHNALLIKLVHRNIPVHLLSVDKKVAQQIINLCQMGFYIFSLFSTFYWYSTRWRSITYTACNLH